MKKHYLYISALILSLLVSLQTASAKSVVDELIEKSTNQPKTAVAQNMYLEIYKEINDKPQEKTASAISTKYKMTEDQINKVVKDGDLSPLTKSQKNLTLDELMLQYKKISNDYGSTLETENLRSELELQTKPSEIFMDGDTSNSEFDILYDLTVIEVILFNSASTSEFGGQFITPDFDFSDKEDEEFINSLFNRDNNNPQTDGELENNETSTGQFSALSCLDNEESVLDTALSNFEENQQNQNEEETSNNENAENNGDLTSSADFPKAQSDEWPTKYLCPDGAFYCIDITFDMEAAKAYSTSDNCIACHVQNINKALDKLLAKPLSANKLSGNLFEVPKCKASYSNLPANMNIIMVAVAPPRQSNQDKYIKLDIDNQWIKIKELFNAYFNNADNPPPQSTIEDRSIKEAIQGSSENATLEEITIKAQNRVQTTKEEIAQDIKLKKQENELELANTGYQMAINELEAMKQSLNTILKQLKEMKTPCTELSIKPYCS